MKRIMVAVTALMVMMAVSVWAQQAPGSGPGQGGRGRGQQMYDPAKTETIPGEVTAVNEFISRKGMNTGIHLTVNSGGKSIVVHLGPQFYLDKQPIKIAVGDQVEVSGVKASMRGQEVFLAGEVKKGGEVLKLRDEQGRPLWAGTGPQGGKRMRRAPVGC